jgi:hypothetical protein
VDSLINAAAQALAKGDPLGALNWVALRDDAPALALRGIAMARLGDFDKANKLFERLYETAYALACDVAVSDGRLGDMELRLLEEIRHELKVERLHAAAIERGARARHLVP